jgi:N6-L-threonylcarbamoyladenine synthase
MKILAIDTSCDETAAAVTDNNQVLSNTIWSQASAHAKFGGVMPSLAQRMHEERIDWVIQKCLKSSGSSFEDMDAVAVTTGPGLSIALGVGIDRAKKLSEKFKKPLLMVNHTEAHLLSPFTQPKTKVNTPVDIKFPFYGLVVSGGNTVFALSEGLGKYKILAETQDDALGEALDKGARMLGLGYPGGAILEKMAKLGKANSFRLPVPLVGQEKRQIFSYSGLKTSFYRLIEANKSKDKGFPSKNEVYDLAAAYQDVAFKHLLRVIEYTISKQPIPAPTSFLLGGGVAANTELKTRLRTLCRKYGLRLYTPYSEKLNGDNAAMVGVCAFLNPNFVKPTKIDRDPRAKLSS